jgi:hypothetical protein
MVAASGWKKALTEATLTIAPAPWPAMAVSAARPTGVTPGRPSRLPVDREPATTCAPSAASAIVTARPMPLPAPVTTATLPPRSRSIGP